MVSDSTFTAGSLALHKTAISHFDIEVDFTTAGETAEYRRGFEACLDLVEDIVGSAKRLKQVKSYLLTVRASMKEKNVARIREDLGL